MEDWLAEVERKEAARWQRAEEAGAFLSVGQTVRVGPHEVEIVKTLADCTQTAVLYRAPQEAMIHPDSLSPPELFGGLHGTMTSDLQIAHFKPVLPHRKTVVLTWQPRQARTEAITTAVPVDRGRTATHDRFLADQPAPVECDGMRVSVADGAAGVVVGLVDIVLEPIDPDILAFSLGGPHGLSSPAEKGTGAGGALARMVSAPGVHDGIGRANGRHGHRRRRVRSGRGGEGTSAA